MIVRLPQRFSGQEIVEAFKNASTFQETSEKRWESIKFIDKFREDESQYESGSPKKIARNKGVYVFLSLFKKKWVFFGKKVWKTNSNPIFALDPLMPSLCYNEVEVSIDCVYSPTHSRFINTRLCIPEHLNSQFDEFLIEFFIQLQPKQAKQA